MGIPPLLETLLRGLERGFKSGVCGALFVVG